MLHPIVVSANKTSNSFLTKVEAGAFSLLTLNVNRSASEHVHIFFNNALPMVREPSILVLPTNKSINADAAPISSIATIISLSSPRQYVHDVLHGGGNCYIPTEGLLCLTDLKEHTGRTKKT